MKKLIKRYRGFLAVLLGLLIFTLFNRELGVKALAIGGSSFLQMLFIVPPIFLILGLLDVWVPREIMVRHMGEGSGLKGILLAFLIGSAAAGPLYGAFPVAAVFMKKGVSFFNILIFIGAWSTTKIPMLLYEISSLGLDFALARLLIDIPGIILIALVLNRTISTEERRKIYENAEHIDD